MVADDVGGEHLRPTSRGQLLLVPLPGEHLDSGRPGCRTPGGRPGGSLFELDDEIAAVLLGDVVAEQCQHGGCVTGRHVGGCRGRRGAAYPGVPREPGRALTDIVATTRETPIARSHPSKTVTSRSPLSSAITAVIPAEQGNSIIVRAASGGTLRSLTTRRWPLIESERGNGTLPFAAQYDAE